MGLVRWAVVGGVRHLLVHACLWLALPILDGVGGVLAGPNCCVALVVLGSSWVTVLGFALGVGCVVRAGVGRKPGWALTAYPDM